MSGNVQEQLKQIAIGQIAESTTNPRKSFAGMEDLKASIAESGIQVPLLVREVEPADGAVIRAQDLRYELVCGARRLRAARELQLATVPCIVRPMDDAQVREAQIVENLQRADVHPVEEAEAYAAMIEHAAGWSKVDEPDRVAVELTAEDIAKRVGKSAGYVAQRLKLLTLGIDAKLLFSRNHLTLGHALLLARLTEADQGRALMWMLDQDPKYVKRPLTEIIRDKLGAIRVRETEGEDVAGSVLPGECRFCGCTEDDACPQGCSWADEARTVCSTLECVEAWGESKKSPAAAEERPTVASLAKYMREGGRLIEATEAHLKRWIEGNVLLKLADVGWRLDDANLLAAAGACVSCPKRSGSNAALFGDLTAAEDVCLDPACFAGKQDALVKFHKTEARKAGADALLKISSKHSKDKLEEPAVTRLQFGGSGSSSTPQFKLAVTKKAVREGQWVPAEAGSCPLTVQGLMVDGPDKGKVLTVCADQGCKVHKHEVYRASSNGGGYSQADYGRQQKEREEKTLAYVAAELPVRQAVYAAIKQKAGGKLNVDDMLRSAVGQVRGAAGVCELAGIPFKVGKYDWETDQNAAKPLADALAKRKGAELLSLVFDIVNVETVRIAGHMYSNRKQDRARLWKLAEQYKVDADAIAQQLEPAAPAKVKKAEKAPAKPAAKKATKKAAKKKPSKGR